MTTIDFTYRVTGVFFPRDGLTTATIEMTLNGEQYHIEADLDEDEGWDISVYLEGVNQHIEWLDGGYGRSRQRDTYFSRTVPMDWLEEWITEAVFAPVEKAIGEAYFAALQKTNGATGTITWGES